MNQKEINVKFAYKHIQNISIIFWGGKISLFKAYRTSLSKNENSLRKFEKISSIISFYYLDCLLIEYIFKYMKKKFQRKWIPFLLSSKAFFFNTNFLNLPVFDYCKMDKTRYCSSFDRHSTQVQPMTFGICLNLVVPAFWDLLLFSHNITYEV